MKTYTLSDGTSISRMAYGCMGLSELDSIESCEQLVGTALSEGINIFDHADIYGAGRCESIFGELLKRNPGWRERMVIQSKCGIRFAGDTYGDEAPSRYDFSFEHIVHAAEESLKRLQIESLDILLLHRPDLLMDPDEVARAFDHLASSGKVRHFGVSNFDHYKIQLLQQSLPASLLVNQLELSLLHAELIAQSAWFNARADLAAATGTLDFCRSHGIAVQAWSPVAGGKLFNPAPDAPQNVHQTSAVVHALAEQYDSNPSAILLA